MKERRTKTREAVETATLKWVAGFNLQRLLCPFGYAPLVEGNEDHDLPLDAATSMAA